MSPAPTPDVTAALVEPAPNRVDPLSTAPASEQRHAVVYVALVAASVALVWLLPFFPSQDGPNHVYNLVILRDLLHGVGCWRPYYSLNLHLAPNLGFTLFAYPWLSVLSPLAAERAFLTTYVLLFALSVPLFLRAFGRPAFPLSYLAIVALFSQPVMMGFYSEIIGTPLLLLAVALAWKLRGARAGIRFAALNLLGLALFVLHLIPFALYLLAAALQAGAQETTWKKAVQRAVLRGFALLPCVLLAATFNIAHRVQAPTYWSIWPWNMLRDFLSFGEFSFSRWQLVPGLAACLSVYLAARTGLRTESWRCANDQSAVRRFLTALCLSLVIAFLCAPNTFGGGGALRRRLPPLILLFSLPLLRPWTARISPHRFAQATAAVAALTLIVNAGLFWQQSRQVALFTRGAKAALPRGALLVTARLDDLDHPYPDPLFHAADYYGLAGAVDLGQYLNTHMSDPYFQVRFLEPVTYTTTGYIYDGEEPAASLPQAQYVLCWGVGNSCQENLAPDFTPYWSEVGDPLSIWKRAAER